MHCYSQPSSRKLLGNNRGRVVFLLLPSIEIAPTEKVPPSLKLIALEGSMKSLNLRSVWCLSIAALSCFGSDANAATVPAGFTDSVVAAGLTNPTAMALAPDGRIFVCQQNGALRVIKNGALLPTPFLTVTVDSQASVDCWASPSIRTSSPINWSTFTTPPLHQHCITASAASPLRATLHLQAVR